MKMTSKKVRRLAELAELALKTLAKQEGVLIKYESGSFREDIGQFTAKFSFTCMQENGVPTDFAKRAPRFGLTADHYGATFMAQGKAYSLVDISERAPKYPMIGEHLLTHKLYKFPVDLVVGQISGRSTNETFGTLKDEEPKAWVYNRAEDEEPETEECHWDARVK
jgi:hypothetical protein